MRALLLTSLLVSHASALVVSYRQPPKEQLAEGSGDEKQTTKVAPLHHQSPREQPIPKHAARLDPAWRGGKREFRPRGPISAHPVDSDSSLERGERETRVLLRSRRHPAQEDRGGAQTDEIDEGSRSARRRHLRNRSTRREIKEDGGEEHIDASPADIVISFDDEDDDGEFDGEVVESAMVSSIVKTSAILDEGEIALLAGLNMGGASQAPPFEEGSAGDVNADGDGLLPHDFDATPVPDRWAAFKIGREDPAEPAADASSMKQVSAPAAGTPAGAARQIANSTCTFCPKGVVDPNLQLPDGANLVCGQVRDQAATAQSGTLACSALQLAQETCCPDYVATLAPSLSPSPPPSPPPATPPATPPAAVPTSASTMEPTMGAPAQPTATRGPTVFLGGEESSNYKSKAGKAKAGKAATHSHHHSQHCPFCPNGVDDPSYVLPGGDGETCGSTKAHAETLTADDSMCNNAKVSERFCCPGPHMSVTKSAKAKSSKAKSSKAKPSKSVAGEAELAHHHSKHCDFCPYGVDDPDEPLPTGDGETCGSLKAHADGLTMESSTCAAIKFAERHCCLRAIEEMGNAASFANVTGIMDQGKDTGPISMEGQAPVTAPSSESHGLATVESPQGHGAEQNVMSSSKSSKAKVSKSAKSSEPMHHTTTMAYDPKANKVGVQSKTAKVGKGSVRPNNSVGALDAWGGASGGRADGADGASGISLTASEAADIPDSSGPTSSPNSVP